MESQILNGTQAFGNGALALSGARHNLAGLLRRPATAARVMLQRWRSRSQLRSILSRDARFYADIGVSRATILDEAGKPFWRA